MYNPDPNSGLLSLAIPNDYPYKIQLKSSTVTFSMRKNFDYGMFNTPGTYNIALYFYSENFISNANPGTIIALYVVNSKPIVNGSNTIPFTEFIEWP